MNKVKVPPDFARQIVGINLTGDYLPTFDPQGWAVVRDAVEVLLEEYDRTHREDQPEEGFR